MTKKDLYLILGISPEATDANIRDAYRKLAKKHHPDKTGSMGSGRFREIAEAYETLSDPGKRERYNSEQTRRAEFEKGRRHVRRDRRPSHGFSTYRPFHSHAGPSPVEPIPGRHDRSRSRRFAGAGPSPISPVLEFEAVLTRHEAETGATDQFDIPIERACPECTGADDMLRFLCPRCMGQGILTERLRVSVQLPAGVREGEIFDLPLRVDSRSIMLRLHIRIR